MTARRLCVLCFATYPEAGPSVRHRISALRQGLAAEGVELVLWSFMPRRLFAIRREFGLHRTLEKVFWFLLATLRLLWRVPQAARFDVVVIHREAFPLGPAWFERQIARVNPHLIFDVDDAIWQPPTSGVDQRAWAFSPGRVDEIMRRSRAVAAGARLLAEHARAHNPHVHLVPTSYPDLGGAPAREAAPDVPVLYWVGNWGNAMYVEALGPVLAELVRRGLAFRLRVVGGPDVLTMHLPPEVPVERLAWRPEHEVRWLREADVGLMPLPDRPYEQGKCAFKLVQYMSAGLPVVASPVGANSDVVAHGESGFLCRDDGEWVEALQRLLSDPALRRRMGRAGYERYSAAYSPACVLQSWRQLLDEALT